MLGCIDIKIVLLCLEAQRFGMPCSLPHCVIVCACVLLGIIGIQPSKVSVTLALADAKIEVFAGDGNCFFHRHNFRMCTLRWQTNTGGFLCTLSPGFPRVGMVRLAGRSVHWRAFVAGRLEGSDGVTDPCLSGEDACPIHGCQITGRFP